MSSGFLNSIVGCTPVTFSLNPFLSKALRKPLIFTGITIALCCRTSFAVPFLPGAKAAVVPCGKDTTQPLSSAFRMFSTSDISTFLLTFCPLARQVLFTVTAPTSLKILVRSPLFMVSSAAT